MKSYKESFNKRIHISLKVVPTQLSICQHIPIMSKVNLSPVDTTFRFQEPAAMMSARARQSYQKYGVMAHGHSTADIID